MYSLYTFASIDAISLLYTCLSYIYRLNSYQLQKPMKKISGYIIKNLINLLIITLAVSLVAISVFIYTKANEYTLLDYDQNLAQDRNDIVEQVDKLTQLMSSDTKAKEIETEIEALEEMSTKYTTKFQNTKKSENSENYQQANQEFLTQIGEITTNANKYMQLFEDDQKDIQKVIGDYNGSVEGLNQYIEAINEEVRDKNL